MSVNELPIMDMSTSETACCPKFNPKEWDEKEFEFRDKPFVMKTTKDFLHMPLNMNSVMTKTFKEIENADAVDKQAVVLSHSPSLWKTHHYFSVSGEVPGGNMTTLSGKYLTKIFEGPYRDAGKWAKSMDSYVKSSGNVVKKLYYYYPTCPKCVKHYKKNYVVLFAEV